MGTDLNGFCEQIRLTLSFGLLMAVVANVALLWAWL